MKRVISLAFCSVLCLFLPACSRDVQPVTAKNDAATVLAQNCIRPSWAQDTQIPKLLGDVRARLAGDQQGFVALVDLIDQAVKARILQSGGELKKVQANDLKDLVSSIHEALNKARASSNAAANADLKLFDDALGYYFTALFEGKYVDRFGATLTAPMVSMTISDGEIAARSRSWST
jgi:hypothetical protein